MATESVIPQSATLIPLPMRSDSAARRRSLPANVAFVAFGNGWYSLCFWGMLILIAKASNQQMVGDFSLGLSIATPALMFASLQTRSIQVSDRTSGYRLRDFLYLRVLTTLAVAVPLSLIVAYTGKLGVAASIVILTICYRSVENIADVFHGALQARERMDWIALSQFLRGTLSVAFMAIALRATGNVPLALASAVLAPILVLLFFDIQRNIADRSRSALLTTANPSVMRRLAGLGVPLGSSAVLVSLANNTPRYAVASIVGDAALGGFAAVLYIVVAGSLLVDAINQSALPVLSRHFTIGDRRRFVAVLGSLCAISAAICLSGLAVSASYGPKLLGLLYRPEYARYAVVLNWCFAGLLLQSLGSTLRTGLIAARRYKVQLPLLIGVSAISVLSAFKLTSMFGVNGAAMSLSVTGLSLLIGAGFLLIGTLRSMQSSEESAA